MRLYIATILIFFTFSSIGQSSFADSRYTYNEGLSDNRVYSMAQDERGFIWIATHNGLNRFDGKNFTVYNTNNSGLLHNVIYEIKKGPPHHFFLATRFGACLIDTRTGIIKNFLAPSIPELTTVANDVRFVEFTSKNELIAGTEGGIYVFDLNGEIIAKHDAEFNLGDIGIKRLFFVLRLSAFSDGSALAATTDGYYYYNSKTKKINRIDELSADHDFLKDFIHKHKDSYIFDINKKDQLFFIDYQAHIDSVFIADIPRKKIVSKLLPFSSWDNIRWDSKIQFHRDSLITITTSRNGYFIYNYNSATAGLELISGFNSANALCQFVLLDNRNKYWIGTETGILQESGKSTGIKNITITDFVKKIGYHPVTSTYAGGNRIWIGAYSKNAGLIVLDKNFQFLKKLDIVKDSATKNFIISISHWSADTLLIGTRAGAFFLDINTYSYCPFFIKKFDEKIAQILIVTSFHASNGEVWLSGGQAGGVWKINKAKDSIRHFAPGQTKNDIPLRNAASIAEDKKGNIWMQNWMDGLTRWNDHKQFFDTSIRKWPLKELKGFNCSGIIIDEEENFWFFINSYGLVRYDLVKNSITRFVATSDQSDDNSNGLLLTNKRFIWMSLRHSILVYDIKTGNLTSLSSQNGLPSGENSSKHLYYDQERKQVLIGFSNQVSAVPLAFIVGNANRQQLYLTGLRSLKDNALIDFKNPVKLPADNNDLMVEFSFIDYDNSKLQPFFEYRLRKDDPWTQIGSQTTLNLNNLGHGSYQIEIRETGSNSNNPQSQASLSFIIKPHYYQTSWFYMVFALMIMGVFYLIYQNRIRQIKKILAVREKIASDLHDDIGSRLTNIRMLSIVSESEKVSTEEKNEYLHRISEEALASGEALDEIVRNVNMQDDDIIARMRHYASSVFSNDSTDLQMNVEEPIILNKMNLEKRKDLLLAFKEILNNIRKHAKAKTVSINLKTESKNLVLEVRDDGIGFDVNEFTDRNGIKNIRSRMKKWNGNVFIISKKGNGTAINIHIPH